MASTSANTAGYQTEDQELATCSSTSATPSLTAISRSAKPRNAFEGLAPSLSTYGRSTLPVKKFTYDVFINHRGPDVKEGLATDLYNTLNGIGLRVFLDSHEFELGDFFPQQIEAVIRSASLHVAIFSENYAKSPWCLAELSFMLKTGSKIFPVFYHVQIDDVRYVKGVYAEAFSWHEKKGRYTPEKLEELKKALHNVSFNVGHTVNTKNDETKLLKTIANYAVKVIKNVPLVVAKHPVGLDEILIDFERTTLQVAKSHDNVKIVGICGMGGAGKTTLAKKYYNSKHKTMERCSFLFDVRDAAYKSVLHIKQNKLMEDLGFKDEKVDSVEEGKSTLFRHLKSGPVLIVVDDVDHVDQLDALVPQKDNLRQGSLIVVTTRQFDVLTSWGISSSSVYKMKELNPSHCKQLFSWHAFSQPYPKDGYAKLVEKFIKTCDGLPLSLIVFGAQLYGKSEQDYWNSQLERMRRIPPGDIKNRLRVSYDALDDEEEEAFLDVACFFIGEEKSLAIEVWNGTQGSSSGLCSWESLLKKCLVEVDEMECIRMHDHLRDLGRDIAYQQSPHRLWLPNQSINVNKQTEVRRSPNQLSSLCLCIPWQIIMNAEKQVEKVEKQVEKRISIRGIMAASTRLEGEPGFTFDIKDNRRIVVQDGSSRQDRIVLFNTSEGIWTLSPFLVGLKFIVVSGHDLDQVIGEASRELVWLRWFDVGRRNLPSGLSLKKLRVLEIYEASWGDHHFEELWETDVNAPIQLRELVISGCSEFQRLPESIGFLKHLKKIVVEQMTYPESWRFKLRSLPSEFCLLQSLELLKLCCQLSSLPDNFGDLRNLRYLYLSGCFDLRRLPVSFKRLTLLQHLHLEGFFELTLEPDIMEYMTKLEYFNLFDCKKLEELPRHITNQRSLKELHLSTESLREVPLNISQLSKLQKLFISSELLTSLPTSLGNLSSLTSLKLRQCSKLKSLPDSLGGLCSLTSLDLYNCPKLEHLPHSLGDLCSLASLDIYGCKKLEALPNSVERLCLLEDLIIRSSGAKSISVRELNNLKTLRIENCPISELDLVSGSFASSLCNLKRIELHSIEVSKISISEDCCPVLQTLSLRDNSHLVDIEVLPTTVKDIKLDSCKTLRNIGGIDGLVNIEKLSIIRCPEFDALPSVALFASLEEFELNGCNGLKEIRGSEHWTALEEMTVERLRRLQLIAISRSVVEPYIQTMKKWPLEEIVVCVRALPDAASFLCSAAFPNVSIVASVGSRKIAWGRSSKLVQKWFPRGDAIIACFVIHCVAPRMLLELQSMGGYHPVISEAELEEGKWVWLAVFTKRSLWWTKNEYDICCSYGDELGKGVLERAMVGIGEHSPIVEAFYRLWGCLPE